jgi:hypothetical protein
VRKVQKTQSAMDVLAVKDSKDPHVISGRENATIDVTDVLVRVMMSVITVRTMRVAITMENVSVTPTGTEKAVSTTATSHTTP